MNELEAQLHYPFGDALPPPGGTLEVAPGVKWIRMRLPFALDHINLWLLRDTLDGPEGPREGWTVVDCCISKDESRAQWETIFANELEDLPILRVIVTHMHPDHIGLAHWLCARWNAPLWMSATDYHTARLSTLGPTGFGGASAADFFVAHGLSDPEYITQIRGRTNYYPGLVPDVPSRYHRMMDGQVIAIGGRQWTCISGYGHAPEHIALSCPDAGLLISGDMILPRISTNVSVYDAEPESNPLTLFLQSIDKFKPLSPETLTLPSHGKPFKGLHTRIAQLHAHHHDRLAEVMEACEASPCSGADILPVMFKRKLDVHQTTFALGEAVAHLHTLWFEGKLKRRLGADGVYRFQPA
ncbi:MBL fold metallo-hydrolase [Polaromonas sp. SM01]|uniref:MBL fold metallo-hydrolase n=1 Tax=Polaromonas sp. SM01 TaxID=3085630 RepID=UPI0029820382|nr:MBL fold metallo-hydrolase [Polaromonas sp. SM01]MDW5444721.1 MBL fold metallo-hydrolase [Polaromonas sp. SM01]